MTVLSADALLEIRGLAAPGSRSAPGVLKRVSGHGARRRRRRSHDLPRRDAGAGRRIGLRQDHGRALASCSWSSPPAATSGSVASTSLALSAEAFKRYRRQIQIVMQDPGSGARPAPHGARCDRRGHGRLRHRRQHRGAHATGGRSHAQGQPRPGDHVALSARVLRRPAPAHLHRPRASGRTGAADLRRGNLGARRLDPGADPQPARRPAGRAQAHLPLHHPRPGGGALLRRPRRRHVSRPHRRDRAARSASLQTRHTPIPRRCWPRSPRSIRNGGASNRWRSEMCPHQSAHHRVATFTHAVRCGSTNAAGTCRRSCRCRMGCHAAC